MKHLRVTAFVLCLYSFETSEKKGTSSEERRTFSVISTMMH